MTSLETIDQQNIWHPFSQLQGGEPPIFVESAKGVHLITSDGRKIIDAVSSWWVNLHGHSNEFIADAISLQARKLEHVIFAGFTHEPAISLSQNLLSILPDNQKKIFYSDNGSTAVEVALKIALQHWANKGISRTKIIAIDGAYHGDTFGAMSVGERSIFTDPFRPLLFHTEFITYPDSQSEERAWEQFKAFIDRQDIAAFIYEPLLQGASGMRMYRPQILDRMIQYAQRNDVICIADEVLTGFGRTGKLFASEYMEHKPDLMAMSKGITGGTLPLGVTSCSEKVLDPFKTSDFLKTFFHGHSYTANPLACAAANASFAILMSSECGKARRTISDNHERFIDELHSNALVKEARSLGTVCAIELKTSEDSSYQNSLRKKIYPYFLSKNILLRPLGNVIYILPPYIITEEELEQVYQSIRDFLTDLSTY